MTEGRLPTPRTGTEKYLAAVLDTLGEIRDHLTRPATVTVDGPGPVAVAEPAPPRPVKATRKPAKAQPVKET